MYIQFVPRSEQFASVRKTDPVTLSESHETLFPQVAHMCGRYFV